MPLALEPLGATGKVAVATGKVPLARWQESNTFASKLIKHTSDALNCLQAGCEKHKKSDTFASKLNKHTSDSLNCLQARCGNHKESNTVASKLDNHVSEMLTRASSWRHPCLRSAAPANVFRLVMLCRREPSGLSGTPALTG